MFNCKYSHLQPTVFFPLGNAISSTIALVHLGFAKVFCILLGIEIEDN